MLKGDRFNHTYKVTSAIYNGFITLFEDRNPMHTDTAFAKSKGFADKLMHGNILNGFLSHFVGELLPVKDVVIISQEIRYPKPVYLNDELSFTALVEDVHESVSTVEFVFVFSKADVTVAKGSMMIRLI